MKINKAKKDGKIGFFCKYSESKSKYDMDYSALSERKECVEGNDHKLIMKNKKRNRSRLIVKFGKPRDIFN